MLAFESKPSVFVWTVIFHISLNHIPFMHMINLVIVQKYSTIVAAAVKERTTVLI